MAEIESLLQALDNKLLATDDPIEMANIYYDAGLLFEKKKEIDEACFFITQAYIFASHNGQTSLVQSTREFLQTHKRI